MQEFRYLGLQRSPRPNVLCSSSKKSPPPARNPGNKSRLTEPIPSVVPATPEPAEVPQLGWLWQVGKGGPSAGTTVSNLREDRIKPKKSLGQNFLTDDGILENIVASSGVRPGDLVLEIGPGTGNLTKHLLQRGALVTAVEKDDTLYERLVEEYKDEPNLRIVHGDVLRTNVDAIIRDMLSQERQGPSDPEGASPSSNPDSLADQGSTGPSAPGVQQAVSKVKVVANLPYNITKEFLKMMLPKGDMVSELSIMIQEEVAQRLVNKTPGRSDYRAMNLRVLFYSKPIYRFLIPKDRYFPPPGVDGALVTFRLLPPASRAAVPSEKGFLALVGKAFLERRKMMRNSVQPLYTTQQVEAALVSCGLRPDARAQDLGLEDFVGVHRALGEMVLQDLLPSGHQEAVEQEYD